MDRRLPLVTISICFLLNSCVWGARKANVTQDRYIPTRISPAEGVVIILHEASKNSTNIESESKEREIESCIGTAMRNENQELKMVSAKEFRNSLFPGKRFEETARSTESLLSALQDNSSRYKVDKLGLRYVIVVGTHTSTFEQHGKFELSDRLWAWGYTKSWTRSSRFWAIIIDVRQRAKAGRISSSSDGNAGYVIPVLLVIPLPPMPFFAATESKACFALGVEVGRFLVGNDDS